MTSALDGKELAFSPRTHDLEEFEALGAAAKDAGFTHLFISDLAERSDFTGEEVDSPWCEWSAILPSLFKHVTPPGLEDAYPEENVKHQYDFMLAKYRICEKLGMRAAYYGTEPHWLNERVYRKHPTWRGSRCDNSLRATGMYYAPNTDDPGMRAAYREGVRMLCSAMPGLDIFTFTTNDSGGFYPWDERLFSGINGPTGTMGKDMGLRVVEFLRELRAGALDAGVDAKLITNVYGWFKDDAKHLVLRSLEPGLGVNGPCPGQHFDECSFLNCGGSIYLTYPQINERDAILNGLHGAASVLGSTAKRFHGGGNSVDQLKAFKFATQRAAPANDRERLLLRHAAAIEFYGEDVADDVVDAWTLIDRARQVGGYDQHCYVALRWMVRPLVAHQDMLSEEELSYWAPLAYYSKGAQPDTYLDYLNCSGYRVVYNWEQASTIACNLDRVEETLKQAADKFLGAAEKVEDDKIRQKLEMEGYRAMAERSMALTTRHVLQVGTLIYRRDEENKREPREATTDPRTPTLPKGELGDRGLWYMHRAMRWELDNTYELIELIKRAPEPIHWTAPLPSFEGPLVMGPDILEQLEKKVEIMLKHWRDAEIGYYRATLGG
jgi:hypothetical protein